METGVGNPETEKVNACGEYNVIRSTPYDPVLRIGDEKMDMESDEWDRISQN